MRLIIHSFRCRGSRRLPGFAVLAALLYNCAIPSLRAEKPLAAGEVAHSSSPPIRTGPAPAESNLAPDYRLAPRDLMQFQISEEPDLLTIQRVSTSGEIAVPMLGTVKVGGMTLREAEQMMNRQYVERGFFIKPQVILSLQTYAPRSVTVLGQVNKPEQIEFPLETEEISLVRAITAAGGFTRIARTDAVRVNRRVGDHDESITVNVDQFLGAKNFPGSADFALLAGDVVFVPERTF